VTTASPDQPHDQPHSHPPGQPWYADLVLPVLLGAARATYGDAIRSALEAAGFHDMPRTGARAVGGIARQGANLRNVAEELGISKQAASQLVDVLVLRGYCERIPDPDDRRRVTVGLTERGRAAAAEINRAVAHVDQAVLDRFGSQRLHETREVLGALVEIATPRSS
jgi:DNA-binding MarR family transcriptional regulator